MAKWIIRELCEKANRKITNKTFCDRLHCQCHLELVSCISFINKNSVPSKTTHHLLYVPSGTGSKV